MLGKLVVFEGVEGSGKTTQLDYAYQWLLESEQVAALRSQGKLGQVIKTREPGGTALGKRIRELLLVQGESGSELIQARTELLLYAADRAQHVAACLRPWLAQGAIVLCDRYTDSTIAYQGYGRGLDLSLIHQLNAIATQGLQSDLTFWLDVDIATGLSRIRQRGTPDRIEQADLSFHQRVQQGFTTLATQQPDRIHRINAARSAAAIAAQIQAQLTHQLALWYAP